MDELPRKQYREYFTIGERILHKGTFEEKGQRFYKLVDCPPEDLKQLVRQIHKDFCDTLPNDWLYESIYDAFADLEDNDLDDINIEGDFYNSQLYEWLGQPYAHGLCNEVMTELQSSDIYEVIQYAQQQAKNDIYRAVDEFIKE